MVIMEVDYSVIDFYHSEDGMLGEILFYMHYWLDMRPDVDFFVFHCDDTGQTLIDHLD